jgi:hypothetical protein
VYLPLSTFECLKHGLYIMVPEPISTAYFINLSLQSVFVRMRIPPITARQRLGTNVTAVPNTHVTIKESLDASFSMQLVSYRRKVGDQFFPELLVSLLKYLRYGRNITEEYICMK